MGARRPAPSLALRLRHLAISALLLACAPTAEPEPTGTGRVSLGAPPHAPRHVAIAFAVDAAGARVVGHRRLDGPLPLDRGGGTDPWRVVVEGASAEVLHQAPAPAAGVLRAELAAPNGQIEHVHLEGQPGVVTVRVPDLPGAARLKLLRPASASGESKPGSRTYAVVADVPFPGDAP